MLLYFLHAYSEDAATAAQIIVIIAYFSYFTHCNGLNQLSIKGFMHVIPYEGLNSRQNIKKKIFYTTLKCSGGRVCVADIIYGEKSRSGFS